MGTAPTVNVIARAQSYNAFGEVVQEVDGRGNATDSTYNSQGQLIQKSDPETNATLNTGAVMRVRPTTVYYYDSAGNTVAMPIAVRSNTNTTRWATAGISTPAITTVRTKRSRHKTIGTTTTA